MIDQVKAKVIELVPSSRHRSYYGGQDTIRIGDVLRAIGLSEDIGEFEMSIYGEKVHFGFTNEGYYTKCYFDLTVDYDNQTQEVKDFIGSLIGVNK